MLEQVGSLVEEKVLDEYLGFEIRGDVEGPVCAVAKFAGSRIRVLRAPSVPLARKRIWQWWNCLEVSLS